MSNMIKSVRTYALDTSNPVNPPSTDTLAADITTSDTAITLTGTGGVTNTQNGSFIAINFDLMQIVSGGGTTSLVVTRSATAASHALGDTVNLPGFTPFYLLPTIEVPNQDFYIYKATPDLNYVLVICYSTDSFRDGFTSKVLADASDSLGTLHIHAPSGSTIWIQTAGAGGGTSGGGGGGGVSPPAGGVAPPVTIDPVASVLFMRNNHKIEVDVVWRKAGNATGRNFSGVAVYLEDPDISSGSQTPLDSTVVLDGSAQVSGDTAPAHVTDSTSSPAVVYPDSATTYTQSRNVRIYLASFGPGGLNPLVRANDPSGATATPNIMVEVPIGPDQGQSGMEWAFLVDKVQVSVATDYNRPDPKYSLVFVYDPPDPSAPVPPGVNRFGGVRIVYIYYDAQGNPVFEKATDTGIDVPATQASIGYKSSPYDASAGGGKFRVYFCSEDDSTPLGMHVNSLVDGVTPFADAIVPPIPVNSIDVGKFTISDQKVEWQNDNTVEAIATFAWSLPDSTTYGKRYAGVRLYLVGVGKDVGNDGSVPLTTFPQALSEIQANVDTGLILFEVAPTLPEIWTIAAISVDSNGGLADDPTQFGHSPTTFHSPIVQWNIGPLPPGDAPLVTVGTGASATATQTMSSDGVGMVSFLVGPWTNPADAKFGGVQVAMVVNRDSNPSHAIFWQVPNGATSFTTPPIPSFGNIGANVPVDFYLVSDDPQGKKNPLVMGSGNTPKIGSTYVPAAGQIIPARSGWFSSEFAWPSDGSGFQAKSFAANKIFVGSQLVVGGAPSSFSSDTSGTQANGQIAVKRGDGTLVAWMGQSEPNQGQGQGPSGVYGGWFGNLYVGGTNPLDAPVFVDGTGIIQVGGIQQNKGAYPYISIRDDTGLEVGRIGAKLNAPSPSGSSGSYGGVGTQPPQLTNGAWFTQLAIGGSNLSNWNVLITPDTQNPLGSNFQMRNIRKFSIDYPAQFSPAPGQPANNEYELDMGSSVWMAGGLTAGQWQFPGIHIYEVDNSQNNFGATFLNRGMVLRGHGYQGYPVLVSLVTFNGTQSGSDVPQRFWGELSMYGPTQVNGVNPQTVYLTSGNANSGNASFVLRDVNGLTLFGVDISGNAQLSGVLSGVPTPVTGVANPVNAYALKIAGFGTVIDATGKWVGPAISTVGGNTTWTADIAGQGFSLLNASEVHGTSFWLGGAARGQGTQMINASGQFIGAGIDVGVNGIACGGLSTVAHQVNGLPTGEIDCGLIKCNNNIVATLQQNPANLPGTGWVVADHIKVFSNLDVPSLTVNGVTVINTNGAFVSPGGIDVGTAGIGGGSATIRGRVNCQSLYASAGAGGDSGDIYFDTNIICWQGVGRVVIDQNRVFTGAAVNVGGGNITCGSLDLGGGGGTGALRNNGAMCKQGLFTCGQLAAGSSPPAATEGVSAGLVGSGQFRAVYGGYGVIFRNDGANFYLLQTNANDPYGSWSTQRPFYFNLGDSHAHFGGSVDVHQSLNVYQNFNCANATTSSTGVVAAANFAVVGGQPGAGTLVDGSRNVFLNQLYCAWWSGSSPVIRQDGQFVGSGISIGGNTVNCGIINCTSINAGPNSITCGSLNLQNGPLQNVGSFSPNQMNIGPYISLVGNSGVITALGFNTNYGQVIDQYRNITCNNVTGNVISSSTNGGFQVGGTTVINNSAQFVGNGVSMLYYGCGCTGVNINYGGGWCYGQTPYGNTYKTIQFTDGTRLTFRLLGGVLCN
jgi:hypothetical protein